MAKGGNAYLGLGFIVSLILAIFPLTSWILGIITRLTRGRILWGILQIIPIVAFVFYFVDLISMIINRDLKWFA